MCGIFLGLTGGRPYCSWRACAKSVHHIALNARSAAVKNFFIFFYAHFFHLFISFCQNLVNVRSLSGASFIIFPTFAGTIMHRHHVA